MCCLPVLIRVASIVNGYEENEQVKRNLKLELNLLGIRQSQWARMRVSQFPYFAIAAAVNCQVLAALIFLFILLEVASFEISQLFSSSSLYLTTRSLSLIIKSQKQLPAEYIPT